MHLLVIGYGNELRRDDGLGPRLARSIEALAFPNVRVLTCHQLNPELADPISQAGAVVFIDAAIGRVRVRVEKLAPATHSEGRAHCSAPTELLLLAKRIWNRCPTSWWITVPAFDLTFGEGVSDQAQAHMDDARIEFSQALNLHHLGTSGDLSRSGRRRRA
jgi:hydrogenase maturation protease